MPALTSKPRLECESSARRRQQRSRRSSWNSAFTCVHGEVGLPTHVTCRARVCVWLCVAVCGCVLYVASEAMLARFSDAQAAVQKLEATMQQRLQELDAAKAEASTFRQTADEAKAKLVAHTTQVATLEERLRRCTQVEEEVRLLARCAVDRW